ncbi:hypothetical protein [Tranquillimonas rosea]|uniref:hypothetical protein n=1 Tax=Tranquillimonas rosea TaxID=641238 RepID=UPI003BAAE50F
MPFDTQTLTQPQRIGVAIDVAQLSHDAEARAPLWLRGRPDATLREFFQRWYLTTHRSTAAQAAVWDWLEDGLRGWLDQTYDQLPPFDTVAAALLDMRAEAKADEKRLRAPRLEVVQ